MLESVPGRHGRKGFSLYGDASAPYAVDSVTLPPGHPAGGAGSKASLVETGSKASLMLPGATASGGRASASGDIDLLAHSVGADGILKGGGAGGGVAGVQGVSTGGAVGDGGRMGNSLHGAPPADAKHLAHLLGAREVVRQDQSRKQKQLEAQQRQHSLASQRQQQQDLELSPAEPADAHTPKRPATEPGDSSSAHFAQAHMHVHAQHATAGHSDMHERQVVPKGAASAQNADGLSLPHTSPPSPPPPQQQQQQQQADPRAAGSAALAQTARARGGSGSTHTPAVLSSLLEAKTPTAASTCKLTSASITPSSAQPLTLVHAAALFSCMQKRWHVT